MIGGLRQHDVVRVGLLQLLAALADHGFDQGALLVAAASVSATFRPLRKTVTVSETRRMSSRKCEMKTMLRPPRASRRSVEQPLDLGRRQRRGRLVEDDDAGAREQHAGELDQLLQADRQIAEPRHRIDVDAESGELLAGLARHAPPLHEAEAVGRLLAEKDVLGDRQVGHDAQLLMHHADAGRKRVARRAETGFPPVEHEAAGELRMHAGDDLHQRAFAGAVFADETMDLAGEQREVDPAQRLDTAEGFRDALQFEDG